jgi:predicted dinucleotide-binding enzyme
MRIGILGSGLMGGKLGTLFARAGHEVIFSYARSEQKLKHDRHLLVADERRRHSSRCRSHVIGRRGAHWPLDAAAANLAGNCLMIPSDNASAIVKM